MKRPLLRARDAGTKSTVFSYIHIIQRTTQRKHSYMVPVLLYVFICAWIRLCENCALYTPRCRLQLALVKIGSSRNTIHNNEARKSRETGSGVLREQSFGQRTQHQFPISNFLFVLRFHQKQERTEVPGCFFILIFIKSAHKIVASIFCAVLGCAEAPERVWHGSAWSRGGVPLLCGLP